MSDRPSIVKPLITSPAVGPFPLGEGYRGDGGPVGYLLRQAVHAFHTAMEGGLRDHRLTSPQFGALFVLHNEPPGLSGADLARAMGTTPQAASLLVAGMEKEGLVRREPHPTHGRILEIHATDEGSRRYESALPVVRDLEARIGAGFAEEDLAVVRRWLVDVARRLPAAGPADRLAAEGG